MSEDINSTVSVESNEVSTTDEDITDVSTEQTVDDLLINVGDQVRVKDSSNTYSSETSSRRSKLVSGSFTVSDVGSKRLRTTSGLWINLSDVVSVDTKYEDYKVGDLVSVLDTADKYDDGSSIPNWIKLRVLKVTKVYNDSCEVSLPNGSKLGKISKKYLTK